MVSKQLIATVWCPALLNQLLPAAHIVRMSSQCPPGKSICCSSSLLHPAAMRPLPAHLITKQQPAGTSLTAMHGADSAFVLTHLLHVAHYCSAPPAAGLVGSGSMAAYYSTPDWGMTRMLQRVMDTQGYDRTTAPHSRELEQLYRMVRPWIQCGACAVGSWWAP